jgi:hypothetical protein
MEVLSRDLESSFLSRAFILSVLTHFVVIAGLEFAASLGILSPEFSLFRKSAVVEQVAQETARRAEQQRMQEQQVPEAELVFMDVDPAQAVPEPPKETKYYSTINTRAANPDPKEDTLTPKIEGKQELIPKMMDTLRPDPQALQPAPAPPPPQKAEVAEPPKTEPKRVRPEVQEEKPELKPEGETYLARAAPKPQPRVEAAAPPVEVPRPRPRTLAEVRAQRGVLEGQKLRQRGGVRLGGVEGMDVKATPFGSYDAAFIAAVQARWFSLLEERNFVGSEAGKVVVEFHLTMDGRITALRVAETEVSETLAWMCQRAILDPAPYLPFPPDLRRMLGRDFRPVRFTFYYNQ